jgi:non-specific serine/threonine protein kinase
MASQVARHLADSFADGVYFVELASLHDDGLVARAVAAALRVRELPGSPLLQTLQAAVRTSRLLLVLDNCEHLLDGCARLVDGLLQVGTGLRVLASFRCKTRAKSRFRECLESGSDRSDVGVG